MSGEAPAGQRRGSEPNENLMEDKDELCFKKDERSSSVYVLAFPRQSSQQHPPMWRVWRDWTASPGVKNAGDTRRVRSRGRLVSQHWSERNAFLSASSRGHVGLWNISSSCRRGMPSRSQLHNATASSPVTRTLSPPIWFRCAPMTSETCGGRQEALKAILMGADRWRNVRKRSIPVASPRTAARVTAGIRSKSDQNSGVLMAT